MTYSEKLRDPRWQKKRLEVMERDGFACKRCGSKDKTLNVHHFVYRKGKQPWEYPGFNFATLCDDCHGIAEEPTTLLNFRRFMVSGVSVEAMKEVSAALAKWAAITKGGDLESAPEILAAATAMYHADEAEAMALNAMCASIGKAKTLAEAKSIAARWSSGDEGDAK